MAQEKLASCAMLHTASQESFTSMYLQTGLRFRAYRGDRKIPAAKEVCEKIGGRVNQLQLVADGLQLGRDLAGIAFPASAVNFL